MLRFENNIAIETDNENNRDKLLKATTFKNGRNAYKITVQKTKLHTNTHGRIKGNNNQKIEQADQFTYLGSINSNDRRDKKDIIKCIIQAKIIFNNNKLKKQGLLKLIIQNDVKGKNRLGSYRLEYTSNIKMRRLITKRKSDNRNGRNDATNQYEYGHVRYNIH